MKELLTERKKSIFVRKLHISLYFRLALLPKNIDVAYALIYDMDQGDQDYCFRPVSYCTSILDTLPTFLRQFMAITNM